MVPWYRSGRSSASFFGWHRKQHFGHRATTVASKGSLRPCLWLNSGMSALWKATLGSHGVFGFTTNEFGCLSSHSKTQFTSRVVCKTSLLWFFGGANWMPELKLVKKRGVQVHRKQFRTGLLQQETQILVFYVINLKRTTTFLEAETIKQATPGKSCVATVARKSLKCL